MAVPLSHTEQNYRDRIAMTRLIAVLCMIYVHVPDGQVERVLHAVPWQSFTSLIQGLLIEGPGRAGASLLSVVSGFLTAQVILQQRYSLKTMYHKRFRSILVPMLFWSLATYFVYSVAPGGRVTFVDEATTLLAHLNILLFLTEIPDGATMHLAFLRDLFVCIVLAPLLLKILRKYPYVLLSALGIFYLTFHHYQSFIVLRPLVLFAFTIGLFLANYKIPLNSLDHHCLSWVGATLFLTVMIMVSNGGHLAAIDTALSRVGIDLRESILYPLCRLCGSLAIWTLTSRALCARGFYWANRLSPYVFVTFCSHPLLLNCGYEALWLPLFGSAMGLNYTVWFILAPVLSLLMAIGVVHIASAITPDLARMITGGREPNFQPRWLLARLTRRPPGQRSAKPTVTRHP